MSPSERGWSARSLKHVPKVVGDEEHRVLVGVERKRLDGFARGRGNMAFDRVRVKVPRDVRDVCVERERVPDLWMHVLLFCSNRGLLLLQRERLVLELRKIRLESSCLLGLSANV
eukprot:Amastigsp_a185943_83.p2 type:complete len:115 gc:universal Amastigsp_a185943_83:173-517(+)